MTKPRAQLLLLGICALSVYLRIEALFAPIGLHPDESYQYVEQGYARLTGTGMRPWEYTDGVRSWVQPGFNGALMAVGRLLGIKDVLLPVLLRSIWGLLSLSLVVASYRASAAIARTLLLATKRPLPSSGAEAGLMGALLCGCFPWIVHVSVHTLSELPATMAIVASLALCTELPLREQPDARRLAMWTGGLAATGVLLRITYAPCAIVPMLAIVRSRHSQVVLPCVLGACVPLVLFGVVDWLTWGAPFVSYIRYIKMNALEGVAASYGVEPASYYYKMLRGRMPVGIWLVVALCVVGLRGGWLQTLTAALLVVTLSLQPHKEERFVVLFWPLCLSAAAGTVGALAGCLRSTRWRRGAWPVMLGITALIVVDAYRHGTIADERHMGDRMLAQSWLGKRHDVTGILVEDMGFSGGQAWVGQPLPMLVFQRKLLGNELFSHVIVPASSAEERAALSAGFTLLHRQGALVILMRSYTKPTPPSAASSG
jgi:GPI mannosyltransferase 3